MMDTPMQHRWCLTKFQKLTPLADAKSEDETKWGRPTISSTLSLIHVSSNRDEKHLPMTARSDSCFCLRSSSQLSSATKLSQDWAITARVAKPCSTTCKAQSNINSNYKGKCSSSHAHAHTYIYTHIHQCNSILDCFWCNNVIIVLKLSCA